MRSTITASFFAISALAFGQWQVPGNVVLNGSTPEDRQVLGVGAPETGTDGVNLATVRTNALTYATAAGTSDLQVVLAPAPAAITPGMRITFSPSSVNPGPVTLSVNGSGPWPVRKNVNAELDSADLRAGHPVDVIFDGATFQVTSQLYPGCPTGYEAVGTRVCVESTPRDSLNWYAAVYTCAAEGKRLCGFSDWFQACIQNANFLGTVSSYEWVDEAANSTNLAKLVGINEFSLLPDCRDGGHRVPNVPHPYRCCYDR